jgi:hypothetical protein
MVITQNDYTRAYVMNDKDKESFEKIFNEHFYNVEFESEEIYLSCKYESFLFWKAALEWERSRLNSSNSDYCDTCGARYEYWTR